MNMYNLHLSFIGADFRVDLLKRVLQAISNAIAEASKNISEAIETKHDEYIESIVDDETSVIEELLGAAFVVCQSYITTIVSGFKSLHERANSDGYKLTSTDRSKRDILGKESTKVGKSKFTEIQVIDAFANYFKHHTEWPGNWNKVKKNSERTVQIIRSVGAEQGSTGNLRKGAEILGNPTYDNIDSFIDKVAEWRDELVILYRKELKSLGVL